MLNEKDIEDCESWEDAKSKLESDSRYQDAPNDEARRQWYMDYLGTCALEGIFHLLRNSSKLNDYVISRHGKVIFTIF